MKMESQATEAFFFEINNFQLYWKKSNKVYGRKFAIYYNNDLLFTEISDVGSKCVSYQKILEELYKNCCLEIDNKLLSLQSIDDNTTKYLKRLRLKFYDDDLERTFLDFQEKRAQYLIDEYCTKQAFEDGAIEDGFNDTMCIKINIGGYDTENEGGFNIKTGTYHPYFSLLPEMNDNMSFVNNVISIKKKFSNKLIRKIDNLIKIESANPGADQIEISTTKIPKINSGQEIEFNKNHFNKEAFLLFEYLNENYIKSGKVKFINIYYFIKSLSISANGIYMFSIEIKPYVKFISIRFNISIKKFEKARFAYDEKEHPKLKELEKMFRKQLK